MRTRPTLLAAFAVLALSGCGGSDGDMTPGVAGQHSGSIAIDDHGDRLFVVNPDADSVSVVDAGARKLVAEIALGDRPKTSGAGDYLPAIEPRAIAISSDATTLYVTGERSGQLYVIDVASARVKDEIEVGSEPIGLFISQDGASALVACSLDATVVRVYLAQMQVCGRVTTAAKPWGLAWSADATSLIVSHLLSGTVSTIDAAAMQAGPTWTVPETPPRGDRRLAHGQVRGAFDVAVRPRTPEVWIAHMLLGIDTAQPELDFESTAFPALSLLNSDGAYQQTLTTDAQDIPGIDGAFADIVSGPHAIAFTHDGGTALMVDAASEDVMAIDAGAHAEAALLRPLPGHQPEGIVISPDDTFAYVDERNTGDVVVVRIDRSGGGVALSVDGAPIPRFAAKDPMPAELRLGQHLFYSANSDEYPITKNHWIACATCHLEGRSDAVTWRFAQGPRDTPSNAGGTLGTGFLFRTADRRDVEDYFRTINIEQGGAFDPANPEQAALLKALEGFVDHAIPLPVPPKTDAAMVAKGKAIFERSDVKCSTCHVGPRFTDSGSGNPKLDLKGYVALYYVGTCVTEPYADVAHEDVDGDPRRACFFDTPSLNGVSDSAPYLHDGSAATLRDVLEKTRGQMGDISSLSSDDLDALVEYLRSL